MTIDNYLYQHRIPHAYESPVIFYKYQNKTIYCDFYLPEQDTYIEYFGKLDDPVYLKRAEDKILMYESNGLNLVCMDSDDIKRVDKFLSRFLADFETYTDNDKPFTYSRQKSIFRALTSCPD